MQQRKDLRGEEPFKLEHYPASLPRTETFAILTTSPWLACDSISNRRRPRPWAPLYPRNRRLPACPQPHREPPTSC
jgi:hypothetical protein